MRWPGVASQGRFVLYASARGALLARPGEPVAGADRRLPLVLSSAGLPAPLAERFRFLAPGPLLNLADADLAAIPQLLAGQVLLVREQADGRVLEATGVQLAGVLDDLYADAAEAVALGVQVQAGNDTPTASASPKTAFRLWAPTARRVAVCVYDKARADAVQGRELRRDASSGVWEATLPADLSGRYYRYLVEVFVPAVGVVRNRVTDPYSISLDADSRHSYIADLDSAALKPEGWEASRAPQQVRAATDMVIYELHVRDFSINDYSVPALHRGRYRAFAEADSDGVRHLRALAQAGLTDVHLLPVFDFATVPEIGCLTPKVPDAPADSLQQQAAVMAVADRDCFNWGYDPFHFNAPEGSYASDADDGTRRILEFRQMVMALHRLGLRVGMDVVYNHTSASGQHPHSVLDRVVPGYYQRYDAEGRVETSTCCDNTATEQRMMAKLMIDSVQLWATQYKIDSFRFDLMGHQPRAVMESLRARVDAAAGREVQLLGEGWNFGEVADGARFVQASQLALNGSGIGTFSDRTRDALRGGGPSDSGLASVQRQGWVNGLGYDRNALAPPAQDEALGQTADLVKVGLAGSLRDYPLQAHDGAWTTLERIGYHGQPAGYASQPAEVVNYVENHDNQTLFDNNVYKLPAGTTTQDRARVQVLALAITAFSQGVAYFHAGVDVLRSKSMDRNSFNSGDWFNRLDWTYRDNHFGSGLPPEQENAASFAQMAPLLRDPGIKPAPADIAWTRDAFRDLLRIRASSGLLRLRSAGEIRARLSFPAFDTAQAPALIAGHLRGQGYADGGFQELLYLVNAGTDTATATLQGQAHKHYVLHPVHRAAHAADRRALQAGYDPEQGRFSVPPRTAVVFVIE